MMFTVEVFPPEDAAPAAAVPRGSTPTGPDQWSELRAKVNGDDEEQVERAMASIWSMLQEPSRRAQFNQAVALAKEALEHFAHLPPSPSHDSVIPAATFTTLQLLAGSRSLAKRKAAKYLHHALECMTMSPHSNVQALSALPTAAYAIPARFAPALVRQLGAALDSGESPCPELLVAKLAALHKSHGVPVQRSHQLAACRAVLAAAATDDHDVDAVLMVPHAFRQLHDICPLSVCQEVLESELAAFGFRNYAGALLYGTSMMAEYRPAAFIEELLEPLLPCAVRVLAMGPHFLDSSAHSVLLRADAYLSIAKVLRAPGRSPTVNSGYVLWLAKQAVKKRMQPTDCLTPEHALIALSFVRGVPDAWGMLRNIMPKLNRTLLRSLASEGIPMIAALIVVNQLVSYNPSAIAGYGDKLLHRLLHIAFSGQLTTNNWELFESLQGLLGAYMDTPLARGFLPRIDELCKILIELPDAASHSMRWSLLATLSCPFASRVDKWIVKVMPQVLVCIKTAASTGAVQGAWVRSALAMVSAFARHHASSAPLSDAALDACLQLCESTPAKNCYCIQTQAWEACADLAASISDSSLSSLAKRILALMTQNLAGHTKLQTSHGCANTVSAQHGVFAAAAAMLPSMGKLPALNEQLQALASSVVTCLAAPARCPHTRAAGCCPFVPPQLKCASHCTAAVELAMLLVTHPTIRAATRVQLLKTLRKLHRSLSPYAPQLAKALRALLASADAALASGKPLAGLANTQRAHCESCCGCGSGQGQGQGEGSK